MAKSKSTPIDKSHGMVTKSTPMPEQALPVNLAPGRNPYGKTYKTGSTPKHGIPTGVPTRPKS